VHDVVRHSDPVNQHVDCGIGPRDESRIIISVD
jgi:hypothetical protein